MSIAFKASALWLPALLVLQSCIATRSIEAPDIRALSGEQWSPQAVAPELVDFQQLSESEQLNQLIQEALTNNYDLKAALSRLKAAQRAAVAAGGPRWPSLDLNLREQDQKFNFQPQAFNASATFDLSWEIDVWGRVAAGQLQAQASAQQQSHLYSAAYYSLAANVANVWFDAIEARAQLYLAEQRRDNVAKNLSIIRDGFNSGIRDAFDVYSADAELASNSATVKQRERRLRTVLRQLSLLLGRPVSIDFTIPRQFPVFNAAVPSELASDLILRRPDLRAAGQSLAAQQARLGVAKANRLPRFSLTASNGSVSETLGDVISDGISTWSVVGGITAPLFRGNQLRAEQQRQYFLLEAEIAGYQQTALQAFVEVEQRLDDEQTIGQQVRSTAAAVQSSHLAEQQALELYVSGITNLNTWLQAQRTAFDRQSALLQLQNQLLKNRVALYLALGGDFNGDTQS